LHELSAITAVVDTVDDYLKASYKEKTKPVPNVTRVVLQIGRKSSYLAEYIYEIWPVAVNGTSLECAALETEQVEGGDFLIKEIEIEE
jgi:Zn finger protein HypA/HybF involved in hydrogenase expression